MKLFIWLYGNATRACDRRFDRDMMLLEPLEQAHVREPERAPALEREPDGLAMFRPIDALRRAMRA